MGRQRLFGYESKQEPVLPRRAFVRRLARNALILIGLSLFGGMIGYHRPEDMSWIDAFADASMILSVMGPVSSLLTWGTKLFAGLSALYSGLVLIFITGIILAWSVHRVLHRFSIESEQRVMPPHFILADSCRDSAAPARGESAPRGEEMAGDRLDAVEQRW